MLPRPRLYLLVLLGLAAGTGWFLSESKLPLPGRPDSTAQSEEFNNAPPVVMQWEAVETAHDQAQASGQETDTEVSSSPEPPEDRLLKEAVLLESRRDSPDAQGRIRELKLWRTSFKHPLIREETWRIDGSVTDQPPIQRGFSVADHAMIKFPAGLSEQDIQTWAAKRGFTLRHRLRTTPVYLVAASPARLDTVDTILAAFRESFPAAGEQASVAERDSLYSLSALLPNDTSFHQSWGLHNTGQTGGVNDADIDAPEAWQHTTGSHSVKVAVIDSGVDYNHPDLAANIWKNPGEIAGNGQDDDENGYVDDVYGWDFYSDDNVPLDSTGHGTHCAGIIGATGNNKLGVVGVNWKVSIVSVRFSNSQGVGSTSDAIDAVNYTTGLGVDLTSNSWGGPDDSLLLEEAIRQAGEAGILFVSAAGNSDQDLDRVKSYPAGHTLDNIIAVASTTQTDRLSSFSNYGKLTVDLAAPGSEIYSTLYNGSYGEKSGTSMAAPHVAGALALARSVAPEMPADQLKERLLLSTDRLAGLHNLVSGGRLNVGRMIQYCLGPQPVLTGLKVEEAAGGNGDGIFNPGEALAISFGVQNAGIDLVENLQVKLSSPLLGTMFTITRGSADFGDLTAGQAIPAAERFEILARADVETPHDEDLVITLTCLGAEKTQSITIPLQSSSQVAGQVRSAVDGTVLPGATVHYTGPMQGQTTTDAQGRYTLVLAGGDYQIKASASGYLGSSPQNLEVPPDQLAVDMALQPPALQVTPQEIQAEVPAGTVLGREVTLVNRGSTPLTWNLHVKSGRTAAEPTTLAGFSLDGVTDPDGGDDSQPLASSEVAGQTVSLGKLNGVRIGVMGAESDRAVLLADLSQRGAVIVPLPATFTAGMLQDVSMIVVDDTIRLLTPDQIELLRDRVRQGAGLLCEADDNGSMGAVNALFADTGISAFNYAYFYHSFTDIATHPMTWGVKTLTEVSVTATARVSPPAQTLVRQATQEAHVALTQLGLGSMVFVGNELTHTVNFASGDARVLANQIFDGLAGTAQWVLPSASTGVLAPGATSTVTLQFDARPLFDGSYDATAFFVADTPDAPQTILPVTMIVRGTPDIELESERLDFGILEMQREIDHVVVKNLGSKVLNLNQVSLAGTDAAAFFTYARVDQIQPGQMTHLQVNFNGSEWRSYTAELVIETDDPDEPRVTVALTGTRVQGGDVRTTTPSLTLTLKQGDTGQAVFKFRNPGTQPLEWEADWVLYNGRPSWAALAGPSTSGSLAGKKTQSLNITANTAGLAPGGYYPQVLQLSFNGLRSSRLYGDLRLNVLPAPLVTLTETSLVFPETFVKGQSEMRLGILNPGEASLTIRSVKSASKLFIAGQKLPLVVPPGGFRELPLVFTPNAAGVFADQLQIKTNAVASIHTVAVSGSAIAAPVLTVTPAKLPMLTVEADSQSEQTLQIQNTGSETLHWQASTDTVSPPLKTTLDSLNKAISRVTDLIPSIVELSGGDKGSFMTGGFFYEANNFGMPYTNGRIASHRQTLGKAGRYFTRKYHPGLFVCVADASQAAAWHFGVDGSMFTTTSRQVEATTLAYEHEGRLFRAWIKQVHGGKMDSLNQLIISEAENPEHHYTILPQVDYHSLLNLPPTSRVHYLMFVTAGEAKLETESLQQILESYLQVAESSSPWLSLESSSGALDPDEEEGLRLHFNSTGLSAGSHKGSVMLTSNDPLKPSLKIPVSMRVKAAPVLACLPEALHIPQAWTGKPVEAGLLLRNTGSQTLKITSITSDQPGLILAAPFSATLAAGAAQTIKLRLQAETAGDFEATIQIVTNASDNPQLTVPVTATALDEPKVEITPASITATVLPGSPFAQTVTLSNPGGDVLRWWAEVFSYHSMRLTQTSGTVAPGGEGQTQLIFDGLERYAGMRTGTLRFVTDSPDHPMVEIPLQLTVPSVPLLDAGPELSFPDTFVGLSSTLAWTLRNPGNQPLTITGITSSQAAFTLQGVTFPITLPAGAVRDITVHFTPTALGPVSGSFTIASNAGNSATAEVNFSGQGVQGPSAGFGPDLSLTMGSGTTQTATMIITNAGSSDLTWSASLSGYYPFSQLAAILSPLSGTTAPGQTSALNIALHPAAKGNPGNYSALIRLTTNDPQKPLLSAAVTVTVQAVPRLSVLPGELVFPDTFANGQAILPLKLENGGNAKYSVTGITSTTPEFSYAGDALPMVMYDNGSMMLSRSFVVKFEPEQAGDYSGRLDISTNIPGFPVISVPVRGRALPEPRLLVTPSRIDTELLPGQSREHRLTVANTGPGQSLDWKAELVTVETPAVVHPQLEEVQNRFEAAVSSLKEVLPDLYDFSEDLRASSAYNGQLYSRNTGGNHILRPNSQWGTSGLPYTQGQIREHPYVGAGGRYFTQYRSDLFFMAADLEGITRFHISGSLEGYSSSSKRSVHGTVVHREVRGTRFTGFFKQSFGILQNSVNHLIVTEERPGLTRSYPESEAQDEHEVTGLSGRSRLYYLLFSTPAGTGMLTTAMMDRLMETFVDQVAMDDHQPWATLTPLSGSTAPGASSDLSMRLHARPDFEVGVHPLTLRLTSNAPVNQGVVDVPVTLTVQPRVLEAAPRLLQEDFLDGAPRAASKLSLQVRDGETADWVVDADVPWITISERSGTGPAELSIGYAPLDTGCHVGHLTVTSGGWAHRVKVIVTVHPQSFTQLLTDHHRGGLLGIQRGIDSFMPSFLAVVSDTAKITGVVNLPSDIVDADVTSDGDTLYAISLRERSLTRVDLRTLTVLDQRPLPPITGERTDARAHYHVQAGRPGVVYYLDALEKPRLHVFDYEAGEDSGIFSHPNIEAVGSVIMAPDDKTLYASVDPKSGSGGIIKLDVSAFPFTLTAFSSLNLGFTTTPGSEYFYLLAGGQELIYAKSRLAWSDLSTLGSIQGASEYAPIAVSAYGDVMVSGSAFYRTSPWQKIASLLLPETRVGAFTADQTRFVYFNAASRKLEFRLLPGLESELPMAGLSPGIPDGAVLDHLPEELNWLGDPRSYEYQAYLGTNAETVEAADPASLHYLGSTSGVSWALPGNAMAPGQTYYWRVDRLGADGVLVPGAVWSFRIQEVLAQPAEIGRVGVYSNDRTDKTATLTISTATPDTPWTLTSDKSWLTFSKTSGTGPATVTVNLQMATWHSSTWADGIILLASGNDQQSIPVKARMLSQLNVTKLVPDPKLPWIYGLNDSYMGEVLWINPGTAEIEFYTRITPGVRDLAVHEGDDRIYVYSVAPKGSTYSTPVAKLHQVERQGQRRHVTAPAPEDVLYSTISIHAAGPKGIYLWSNSSYSMDAGVVAHPVTGSLYTVKTENGFGIVSTTRWLPDLSSQSQQTVIDISAGALATAPVASADGEGMFYKRTAIRTRDLEVLGSGYAEDIFATSSSGDLAVGRQGVYHTATRAHLLDLPWNTPLAAVAPDGLSAVQYDSATSKLRATPLTVLLATPSEADFGQIQPGTTSSRVFELTNHSNQDVTVEFTSTHPAFTGPLTPIPINARESAQITLHFTPAEIGAIQATLTFAVPGQPLLMRNVPVSGTATLEATTTTVLNFGVGAPSATGVKGLGTYLESGFKVTGHRYRTGGYNIFNQVGSNAVGRPSNGSPFIALSATYFPHLMRLVRAEGGLFTPRSVSLAEYGSQLNGNGEVTFRGVQTGGVVSSVTFTLDGVMDGAGAAVDFETFQFPAAFHNLVSLDVEMTPNNGCSLDDLELEIVPAIPAQQIATASADTENEIGAMDVDGDGWAETSSLHALSSSATPEGNRIHVFSYSRPASGDPSSYLIQASRDGDTWITLTQAVDYEVTQVTRSPEGSEEQVELSIQAATEIQWQFRLVAKP